MRNNLKKAKKSRKPMIAVIGDSKVPKNSRKGRLAESVGRELVDAGCRVITGGLGGVMEAASRGARTSEHYSPGDIIGILPGHAASDANDFVDISIPTGLDNVRNSLVAHADAVIAIGGGAGTLSEICLAWIYKRLVIALRTEGWSARMADNPVDSRTRYPKIKDDRVYGADDAPEAVRLLKKMLPRYRREHHNIPR